MAKLTLDLHDLFNKSQKIEHALYETIHNALPQRIKTIEFIPGKEISQLNKRVIRFLEQKHINSQYHRKKAARVLVGCL